MRDKYGQNSEYNFHFNREEFENQRRSSPSDFSGGPFKRNRTLLITLLDIAVIVVILTVVIPFVRKPYEVNNFNGYRLKLSYFVTEENIYLNMLITNKKNETNRGADLVEMELTVGSEMKNLQELLPLPEEAISYRTSFKRNSEAEYASALIRINGEETGLKIKLNDNLSSEK